MKGFIYYEEDDAVRNRWFIDELIKAGAGYDLDIELRIDDETGLDAADFIVYRGRNFEVSRKWEQDGLLVVNRSEVNRIANDKLQTFQLGALLGIPAIPTKVMSSAADILEYPFVVKTADGHGGKDVHLCKDVVEVEEVISLYSDEQLLVQPFIEHNSSDIRLYVIGNEVVGAVQRTGVNNFKANVALGGTAERFEAPVALQDFAERIAKALKSDYIGVDFIQNCDGVWLLNEIEDPVGARSLYKTSDLNVAQEVMRHIHKKLLKSL